MASQLQNINLIAPAFKGVNTEDSPLAQDPSFADVADNAVIDKRGRIAARKGYTLTTTDSTILGTDRIHRIHEFYDDQDNTVIFSTGNGDIFSGTDTLTSVLPDGYLGTEENNWKMLNFNNQCYFFQRGDEPLVYDAANGMRTFSTVNSSPTPDAFKCHEALAAFGRLWIVGSNEDPNTIYWSDLLIGTDFTGGSSGSIDVSLAWPDGYDEVRALAAHNGFLIVFGNHSIVVYGGAESPATMALSDTIAGVGAVCRNSVQHIGTDVLFMSKEGLRSFGRAIQEKALPLTDLSRNIKTELLQSVNERTQSTSSVFSPTNSFYLINFPDLELVYCFDIRGTVENGAYRVTRWPSVDFKTFCDTRDGTLLVGTSEGIGEYSGYSDNGNAYDFRYKSPALSFGDSSRLKMIKKIKTTLVGGSGRSATVTWEYDFENQGGSSVFNIPLGSLAEYDDNPDGLSSGIAEYNDPANPVSDVAEYSSGRLVTRKSINANGTGEVVSIGINVPINGSEFSVQEMNILATIGKIL